MRTAIALGWVLASGLGAWAQDAQPTGWEAYARNHELAASLGLSRDSLAPVTMEEDPYDSITRPASAQPVFATNRDGLPSISPAILVGGCGLPGGGGRNASGLAGPRPRPVDLATHSALVTLFEGTYEDAESINLSAMRAVTGLNSERSDFEALVAAQYVWGVAPYNTRFVYECLTSSVTRLRPATATGTRPAFPPDDVQRCAEWCRQAGALAARVGERLAAGQEEVHLIGLGIVRVRAQVWIASADRTGWALCLPWVPLEARLFALADSNALSPDALDSVRSMARQVLFRRRVFGVDTGWPIRQLGASRLQALPGGSPLDALVAEAMAVPLSFPPTSAELGYAQTPPPGEGH